MIIVDGKVNLGDIEGGGERRRLRIVLGELQVATRVLWAQPVLVAEQHVRGVVAWRVEYWKQKRIG